MISVYILRSTIKSRYYIGHTANLINRLQRHNTGGVRSTKAYKPWDIVYTERYDNKHDAYRREMRIKSYKGGRAFKALLKSD